MYKILINILFILSIAFSWIIFAGIDYSIEYLSFGILCVSGTYILSLNAKLIPKTYLLSFRSIKYFLWLAKEMYISAIYVLKSVWSPNLEITGGFYEFKTKIKSDYLKVLFANSIALTPGTYTVSIEDDVFVVHGFSDESLTDLKSGEMEKRIKHIEEK